MKTPLPNTTTITKERHFPGLGKFDRIDAVIIGAGFECITIIPTSTIGKKLPFVLGCGRQIFFFHDDPDPVKYIHGKRHKNGILLLKLTFKDGNTREITTTPPYTVLWSKSNATDQVSGGNIKG